MLRSSLRAIAISPPTVSMHNPQHQPACDTETGSRSESLPAKTGREHVFWQRSRPANPADFLTVTRDRSWIVIASCGQAGAKGQINLFKRHVAKFFQVIKGGVVTSYRDWASNPYPTGGTPVLMRMHSVRSECSELDVVVQPEVEGMLCVDPDTLPSSGRIYLGKPNQELEQLAALWQLQPIVRAMAGQASPTEQEQTIARRRAATINTQAQESHLPPSGYCPWCECDATLELLHRHADRCITGCPICHHSWCD